MAFSDSSITLANHWYTSTINWGSESPTQHRSRRSNLWGDLRVRCWEPMKIRDSIRGSEEHTLLQKQRALVNLRTLREFMSFGSRVPVFTLGATLESFKNRVDLYTSKTVVQGHGQLQLKVANKTMSVSRAILASRAPKLEQRFTANVTEQTFAEIKDTVYEQELLELFVVLMYADEIEIPLKYAFPLLKKCKEYGADHLVSRCEEVLVVAVNSGAQEVTRDFIFQAAALELNRLTETCLLYCRKNFHFLLRSSTAGKCEKVCARIQKMWMERACCGNRVHVEETMTERNWRVLVKTYRLSRKIGDEASQLHCQDLFVQHQHYPRFSELERDEQVDIDLHRRLISSSEANLSVYHKIASPLFRDADLSASESAFKTVTVTGISISYYPELVYLRAPRLAV